MSGLIILLLWPWAALWNGWALSILWRWFVVPVFGGPTLGVGSAVGLSLIVGYLTHQYAPDLPCDKRGEWEKFGAMVGVTILKPAIALGLGWIVARFML